MLEFKKFEEIINFINSREIMASEINEVIKRHNFQVDFASGYGIIDDAAYSIIIKLLEEIFQDKDGWIDYWFGELSCGENWYPGMIQDKNGKDVKLETVRDLYDLLVENYNDNL